MTDPAFVAGKTGLLMGKGIYFCEFREVFHLGLLVAAKYYQTNQFMNMNIEEDLARERTRQKALRMKDFFRKDYLRKLESPESAVLAVYYMHSVTILYLMAALAYWSLTMSFAVFESMQNDA